MPLKAAGKGHGVRGCARLLQSIRHPGITHCSQALTRTTYGATWGRFMHCVGVLAWVLDTNSKCGDLDEEKQSAQTRSNLPCCWASPPSTRGSP